MPIHDRQNDRLYVARNPETMMFARLGEDTFLGAPIEETNSLTQAEKRGSPSGLMSVLSGHYRNYECVELLVMYETGIAHPWPSDESMGWASE